LQASKLLQSKKGLRTVITKLSSGDYSLVISNLPVEQSLDESVAQVKVLLAQVIPNAHVTGTAPSSSSAVLRYASSSSSPEELSQMVSSKVVKFGLDAQSVGVPTSMKKPSVYLKNLSGQSTIQDVKKFLGSPAPLRVQMQMTSKDIQGKVAVAYYHSEEAAFEVLQRLKGEATLDGKKISVTYRELIEPMVRITNLPENCSQEDLQKFFSVFEPERIDLDVASRQALVVLNNPYDAKMATQALSRKRIGESVVTVAVAEAEGCDVGIKITLPPPPRGGVPAGEHGKLWEALGVLDDRSKNDGSSSSPLSAALNSNRSAFIGFETMQQAVSAHESFIKGKTTLQGGGKSSQNAPSALLPGLGGGLVTSHISVLPSFVVDVQGLDPEVPAIEADKAARGKVMGGGGEGVEGVELVNPIRVDRGAILKFKRNLEVIPAIKLLKTMKIDSQPIIAKRYRPVTLRGNSKGYDAEEDGDDERSDAFSLRKVLKDYMGQDPGLRYQIAKNAFERAVVDAKANKDIKYLLENSLSPAIREEASKIISSPMTKESSSRLFELFLQRDDMISFLGDFREMRAFLGEENVEDPFDWSQFNIESGDDIWKLQNEMKRVDEELMANIGKSPKSKKNKGVVVVPGEGDEKETTISLEDPENLIDKDGNGWSGVILDTDMVQKTMPGNRVNTHRALVAVGNLRGAAGFGMGKGKTTTDAVNAGFRDALRNLTHIDLFDKFGIAHDLHGKHNSCHAYIRSTPRSRMIVGSPFAVEVLTRIGISSCSCKLVGRRDPYAMVRAIFNALEKHENIDEFAKDRGQRYLELRWAYDQNV